MSVFVGKVLWRSLAGLGGQPRGIDLDASFALRCHSVPRTAAMVATLAEFVWTRAKPAEWDRGHIPSDMFTFEGDSLLVREIYLRHTAASGQQLRLNDLTWNSGKPRRLMVRYTYHQQGRPEDYFANEWLRLAFGLWIKFVEGQLIMQAGAG